jgi:hypothetical protein
MTEVNGLRELIASSTRFRERESIMAETSITNTSNQTIPNTESGYVAKLAIAWEMTRLSNRYFDSSLDADERALKLSNIFVKTFETINKV